MMPAMTEEADIIKAIHKAALQPLAFSSIFFIGE
jgi:hypothetical protein